MSALDRRLAVQVRAMGHFQDGEYIPGPVVYDQVVWAAKQDLGSAEVIDSSGLTSSVILDNFTIRYVALVATSPISRIAIAFTEGGVTRPYSVRRVREVGRRRYLELEGVAAA